MDDVTCLRLMFRSRDEGDERRRDEDQPRQGGDGGLSRQCDDRWAQGAVLNDPGSDLRRHLEALAGARKDDGYRHRLRSRMKERPSWSERDRYFRGCPSCCGSRFNQIRMIPKLA